MPRRGRLIEEGGREGVGGGRGSFNFGVNGRQKKLCYYLTRMVRDLKLKLRSQETVI